MRKLVYVREDHWIGPSLLICSANVPLVEPEALPTKHANQIPYVKHPKPHRAKIKNKGF